MPSLALTLLLYLFCLPNLAAEDKSVTFLYEPFILFDFLLNNYSYISYDLINGEGDYLDVLCEHSTAEKGRMQLLNELKFLLLSEKTIADFSRAAKLYLTGFE